MAWSLIGKAWTACERIADVTDRILRGGLIGDHIGKTRLPAALEIMCEITGWTLDFTLIDTADRTGFQFPKQIETAIAAGWLGVSVTHPFKIQAARLAGAGMSGKAARLDAANTLIFETPIKGLNTDFTGFLGAWRHLMSNETPGRVAMAGAGGVAQALGPALMELGAAEITIWDPVPEKAKVLADKLGRSARAVSPAEAPDHVRAADGLVNATMLGMTPYPGTAFDARLLGGQRWAFDAVYTPTNTKFLRGAGAAGLTTISGFDLFKHMAIGTFEAYTDEWLDPDAILARLERLRPD